MLLITKKENLSLLGEEKVQQESKESKGADVTNAFAIDQQSMVHEVKKLNTIVLYVKIRLHPLRVATLNPTTDCFIIPNDFNYMVE